MTAYTVEFTPSPDRHHAVEVAAPPLQGEVVVVQSGFDVAFESLHLSQFASLVGQSLRHPTPDPGPRAVFPRAELIGTGH